MKSSVNQIIKHSFDAIKKDSVLAMLLLKTYSCLYLNNKAPQTCERSMLSYYNQLKKNGIVMAEKKEVKRSYVLNKTHSHSVIYINVGGTMVHRYKDSFSDAEVLEFIKTGAFKKEWFEKLPEVESMPETNEPETKKTKKTKQK